MKRKTLEEVMIASYANVFKEILTSAFRDHEKLSLDFHSTSIKRQREIEREIDNKSIEMARTLVARLKKLGYLKKEPTQKRLEEIIRQVLKQYGVKE